MRMEDCHKPITHEQYKLLFFTNIKGGGALVALFKVADRGFVHLSGIQPSK